MNKILSAFLLLFAALTSICQEADSLKTNLKQAFKDEDFELCCAYAEKLLENATAAKDTNNILIAYYYLGYASQKNGDLENGLKYGTMCYELATLANDQELISSSLNNIGNIYLVNKQDSTALTYFMKSLEIERAVGRKQNQATRLGNISSVYLRLEQYDKALEYAKQGLDLDLEIGRKDKIAVRYNQLGNIYNCLGEFSKSLECQTNSFEYFKGAGSNYGMCITSFAIGQIYDRLANFKECKHYYMQALGYAEKIHNHIMIEKIYKQLYDCSRNLDPAFSLKYLELYTKMKDSVYTAENQQLLQEFQAKYDSQEKQHEIERQKIEIQNARRNLYVIIAFAILLIIIIILLIIQAKATKNKQLLLEKINATKDRMLSIISHDLKNPATAERNVLCQLRKCHKELPEKDLNDILDCAINSSDAQIGLLSNLLEWTRIQISKTKYTPIVLDLTTCIKEAIALFDNQLTAKKITINFNSDEKKFVFSEMYIIPTLLRNLISNAIKYSNEGGVIDITITEHPTILNKYLVSVTDHGIGMSEDTVNALLSDKDITTTPGTSGETGSGLGLGICKRLLQIDGETYQIKSKQQEGSTFSFTVCKFYPHG